jgi:hypothetical protein
MSEYYKPKRTRNIYDPSSDKPFKLSRSKIDLFLNCPRCFYQDRRLGIGRPPGFPFNLNSAVDALLKKEFDAYRSQGKPHPMVSAAGIEAIPFSHEQIEVWRDSLHHGIQFHDKATNLILTGGVDDVWVNPAGELIIVDYKATSKSGGVSLDADWQIGYKRQMSLYAWLFKQNGFKVHRVGYFVYCNGLTNRDAFNKRLDFDISILPYEIDDSWVQAAIKDAHACLNLDSVPTAGGDCDFCAYVDALK